MRGYAAIGLYMPKTEPNVGGAMRAAYCYGASMIAVQGNRFRRLATDPQKSWRHIPLLQVEDLRKVIPFDCQPICVELTDNAKPLETFVHPHRAFYIFGPEDGSVPKEMTERYTTIKAPTYFCMNLAATVNVVLYDRRAKELLGRGQVVQAPDFDSGYVGSIPAAPAIAEAA
jgi:tRNA(Leu) C34 or U34 (ribose-2'-O)-methylase TrmL